MGTHFDFYLYVCPSQTVISESKSVGIGHKRVVGNAVLVRTKPLKAPDAMTAALVSSEREEMR